MYVCMFVCMFVCMYACMYTWICVCIGLNECVIWYRFGEKMKNIFITFTMDCWQVCCIYSSKRQSVNIISYLRILFLGSYLFVTAPEEGHRARLMSEFIQSSKPRWVLCLQIEDAFFQRMYWLCLNFIISNVYVCIQLFQNQKMVRKGNDPTGEK